MTTSEPPGHLGTTGSELLTAVVLNYQNWAGTADVVQALLRQQRLPDRILVVDNASQTELDDETAQRLANAEIVRLTHNDGYAAGMNAGIRTALAAGATAVLLLTHDALLDPGCLGALSRAMAEHPRAGVLAPVLGWRSRPGQAWCTGGKLGRWSGMPVHLNKGAPLASVQGSGTAVVDWSDGACLLVSAQAVHDAGLIPEDYFLYFEEVDFLARIRRAGFEVRIALDALAWQDPGGTPVYLVIRNQLLWLRRSRPASLALAAPRIGAMFAKEVARVVVGRERARRVLAMAAGLRDGLASRRPVRRDLLGIR